jgi:hypothetical protein
MMPLYNRSSGIAESDSRGLLSYLLTWSALAITLLPLHDGGNKILFGL